jgi:SAM-dependent methyltransferase
LHQTYAMSNFIRRVRRHGLLGTARLIPVNIRWIWGALKPATVAARRRERAVDRELGINTAGDVPGGAAAAEAGISAEVYPYQPVVREEFEEMMGSLPRDVSSFCFIDIGSGKGRALVLAARHPFAEVIGIELSASLHRIAEQNIRKVAPSLRGRVKLINQDARQFAFPVMATVIFLFNPFGEEVMREVVRNVERAYRDSSLPIYLLYLWPFQEKAITESNMWQEINRGRHWKSFKLETLQAL